MCVCVCVGRQTRDHRRCQRTTRHASIYRQHCVPFCSNRKTTKQLLHHQKKKKKKLKQKQNKNTAKSSNVHNHFKIDHYFSVFTQVQKNRIVSVAITLFSVAFVLSQSPLLSSMSPKDCLRFSRPSHRFWLEFAIDLDQFRKWRKSLASGMRLPAPPPFPDMTVFIIHPYRYMVTTTNHEIPSERMAAEKSNRLLMAADFFFKFWYVCEVFLRCSRDSKLEQRINRCMRRTLNSHRRNGRRVDKIQWSFREMIAVVAGALAHKWGPITFRWSFSSITKMSIYMTDTRPLRSSRLLSLPILLKNDNVWHNLWKLLH